MDAILDALKEGRLFELPENDKAHALQFLAHVIEALPETPAGTDVVGLVQKREDATSTAIGKGWACPHARVPSGEKLLCVMGWSPKGIDFNAPDSKPVALVAMYLVPDNQRNQYLREISRLAKALEACTHHERLKEAKDLNGIRDFLLDLIDIGKGAITPDAKARMIRLQVKQTQEVFAIRELSNLIIEPLTLVTGPGMQPLGLTQNPRLLEWLDSVRDSIGTIETEGMFQNGGWRVLRRGAVAYQGGRVAYDCLAIRMISNNSIQPK